MAGPSQARSAPRNVLLSKLPADELEFLQRTLQPVELEVPQPLYEPHQPIRHAYFPESGMVSVVSVMEDGRSIEVGTIGREGVVGGVLLMGTDRVPCRSYTQINGRAQRIDAARLIEAADRFVNLRMLILRYESAFLTQSMQGAACNGLHAVQQRCCRWLLTARDRCESDELTLTHEFLALMLGVRRASVSDVLRPLQDAGLVNSVRGHITILNRPALEAGSCECYRVIANQQRRLLDV